MSLLIESIKIHKGKVYNLPYHNQRLNASRKALFQFKDKIDLKDYIHPEILDFSEIDTYKCRVIYGKYIERIEFRIYQKRLIQSLKIVHDNTIDYSHKWENRTQIKKLLSKRGQQDDVLIVKNNHITDTSYCNILCWNGKEWHTPKTPLLKGTSRAKLLKKGILKEKNIRLEHFNRYSKIRLVNAMIDFEDEMEILLNKISF